MPRLRLGSTRPRCDPPPPVRAHRGQDRAPIDRATFRQSVGARSGLGRGPWATLRGAMREPCGSAPMTSPRSTQRPVCRQGEWAPPVACRRSARYGLCYGPRERRAPNMPERPTPAVPPTIQSAPSGSGITRCGASRSRPRSFGSEKLRPNGETVPRPRRSRCGPLLRRHPERVATCHVWRRGEGGSAPGNGLARGIQSPRARIDTIQVSVHSASSRVFARARRRGHGRACEFLRTTPTGRGPRQCPPDGATRSRRRISSRRFLMDGDGPASGSTQQAVTVVVASRDRPALLDDTLAAIRRTLRPIDRLIVVDSASHDAHSVAEVVGRSNGILMRCDRPGVSRARNAGWRSASTDLIAFTDDDCLPSEGWIETLVETFSGAPAPDFVTGRVVPDGGRGGRVRIDLSVTASEEPASFRNGADVTTIGHGANMAWRRSVLDEIGGFDENLGPGSQLGGGSEDADAFFRALLAGKSARFEPKAVVVHRQWRGRMEQLRSCFGYGVGFGALSVKQRKLRESVHRTVNRPPRSFIPALLR